MGVCIALALALTLIAGAWFFQTQVQPPRPTPPNPSAGVSLVYAGVVTVGNAGTLGPGNCTASNVGTQPDPTQLQNGAYSTLCLISSPTGFARGDAVYIIELRFDRSANASTVYQIHVQIDVTPSTNDISVISFLRTSAVLSLQESATYALDVTQEGDTAIVSFAILV